MSIFQVSIQKILNCNRILLFCFLCVISRGAGFNTIEGNTQTCDREGMTVVPAISQIHCFSCVCVKGQVECKRKGCPEDDCYMLTNEPVRNGCCRLCKPCNYQGREYPSGTTWSDPADPCLVITCKAGVITESTAKCYTPCSDPLPPLPGECCPRCMGCGINGRSFTSGGKITLEEDPCLNCTCNKGIMTCTKNACPVLHCSKSNRVHLAGECCPKCNGTRNVLSPPGTRCLLGGSVSSAGETKRIDQCTFCSCMNSTSVCRRDTCPPLNCPIAKQFYPTNESCCLQCPPHYENNRTICQVGDRIFRDKQSWQVSECKSCTCSRGHMHCTIEDCSQSSNMQCPPHMKLHKEPGVCCKKCIEADGVCTVFGDPHYRTFDGQFFNFQGACKYQLTGDCVGQSFFIRVTNDARSTKTSSWTKTVTLRMGKTKVNLGDKMRVKINGERIYEPFVSNLVNVTRTTYNTLVETHLGVKLIWDGNSFLEVSVPTYYKGQLCGLCGNFNSIPRDDFTTRTGRVVLDATTFATSWQVGGRRSCQRNDLRRQKPCSHFPYKKSRQKRCTHLLTDLFAACRKKLKSEIYFKSCLIDMCECSSGKCYCESMTAYAHECQRLGILPPPDWRKITNCSMNHSGYY